MSSSLSPIAIALTFALVGIAVIPMGFTIFRTPYKFWEVVVAACVGAALALIPTVGGIASLAGTLGVLCWRLGRSSFNDIFISVAVAPLLMVPVFMMLSRS
jgi:hypothetical protein